ncbi:hypothetical protein LCGC14_2908560 [marine sediment metagenome]|uniref:Uncharacterized protein n=1 Tax=marine sediment metagenome TaxID=412755 RepID=A0A0F8XSC2_9ZZZZ
MTQPSARKRIWGWFFFDWASQPYNTLLLTFIFGPYIKSLLDDGAGAQAAWGYGIGAAGIVIGNWSCIMAMVFTMALHITMAVVVPRFLGDVNLGKLLFAGVYVTYFGLFTSLGTATYLTKEVARDPSTAAQHAVNAALMRLPLSLMASGFGGLGSSKMVISKSFQGASASRCVTPLM